MTLLQVQNLTVGYGKIKALNNVSLYVDQGEVVTLIGANGSGKSTLLKALSGLLKAESGSVIFNGEKLNDLPCHEIARRGLIQVPEGRHIFPLLSVRENLEMGAYFRKDKARIIKDSDFAFSLFPVLKERETQLGGTLSGGEQQMLAIARALMSHPRLLMLDEPSMGLAPLVVERIFSVIGEISRLGVTVLLIEQNAHLALSIARRGYVLETGSVMMNDEAQQLLANEQVKRCYLGIEN